ncbi:hypothetical protein ACM9XC_09485 [Xanthomonas sacchari]
MFQRASSFACLLWPILATCAAPAAAAAAAPPAATPARPFVEISYVVAPDTVGDFSLRSSKYDPAAKAAGAGFLYVLKDHPELTINVFVYPAGQKESARAIADGMAGFRADLAAAVSGGTYAELHELGAQRFELGIVVEPAPKAASALDKALVAAIAEAQRVPGEKLRMELRFDPEDAPARSNGYLFYKQLYYFKVRVSAAAQDIGPDAFDTLADQAARALVPAIQVTNVGGCATPTIQIDPNGKPEQAALQLVRQSTLYQGFNCSKSAADAGIDRAAGNAAVIEIAYDAGDWASP